VCLGGLNITSEKDYQVMFIKVGSFEIDTRYGFYIKVPGLFAAHRHARLGWTFDRLS
jgi:hypothetical protein